MISHADSRRLEQPDRVARKILAREAPVADVLLTWATAAHWPGNLVCY